ncbi:MAG: hypothetical protein Q8Q08_05105 [Candidatus Omnitrophota bacterium]|nr:hypothetical protein [Candidatus Omnitrophota bacterium]
MKKIWKYYDYCHNPYMPIDSPRGRLSSDSLLYNSLLHSACQKAFRSIIKKIRDAIGSWNTVWGVKWGCNALTWELYFYNHRVRNPRKTAPNLLKVLRSYFHVPPFVEIDIKHQPYFMFSVDLSDDIFGFKQIDGVHLYTEGRPGISQGNSYYWGHDGMYFENHYDFFRMPKETESFVHKVGHSLVLGKNRGSVLGHSLVRQLMPCYTICVAHKKNNDGIYFSRVNVDQLLYFLEHFSYPAHIVDFVRSRKEKLDHLLYDVAFDCALGPQGPVFSKSSYYSVF